MAAGGDSTLSMGHIEELCEIITDKNMAIIAMKYLGIEYETVENFKSKNREDITGFNRDILVKWRNKTQGTTQVSIPALLSNNTKYFLSCDDHLNSCLSRLFECTRMFKDVTRTTFK